MGARDFKLKKVPLFAGKPVKIKVFRSANQELAPVPANRYNCEI